MAKVTVTPKKREIKVDGQVVGRISGIYQMTAYLDDPRTGKEVELIWQDSFRRVADTARSQLAHKSVTEVIDLWSIEARDARVEAETRAREAALEDAPSLQYAVDLAYGYASSYGNRVPLVVIERGEQRVTLNLSERAFVEVGIKAYDDKVTINLRNAQYEKLTTRQALELAYALNKAAEIAAHVDKQVEKEIA